MTDFETIKSEIDKLLVEKNNLEKQITSAKALNDSYVKELSEKYSITPEEIPSHLEELNTKLTEMKATLEAKLKSIREYVAKLKTALAEA